MILIRNPVSRVPEDGKTTGRDLGLFERIDGMEFLENIRKQVTFGVLGETQPGGENSLIAPASRSPEQPSPIGLTHQLQIGPADTLKIVWEHAVEFGVFLVVPFGVRISRLQPLRAILLGHRQGRKFAHQFLPSRALLPGGERGRHIQQAVYHRVQSGYFGHWIDGRVIRLQHLRRSDVQLAVLATRIMLVIESDHIVGNGQQRVPQKRRVLGMPVVFQHHGGQFQSALPIVAHPFAGRMDVRVFFTQVEVVIPIQPEEGEGFREEDPAMIEIASAAFTNQRQHVSVHPEQRLHPVIVAHEQHRPIGVTRILPPVMPAPAPTVRPSVIALRIGIEAGDHVHGEQGTIELHGEFPATTGTDLNPSL